MWPMALITEKGRGEWGLGGRGRKKAIGDLGDTFFSKRILMGASLQVRKEGVSGQEMEDVGQTTDLRNLEENKGNK